MNVIELSHDSDAVTIIWKDEHRSEFDALWLFDNRPEHRDARNGQRLVDVVDLPANPQIVRARESGGALQLEWADGSASPIPLAWLREHCPCAAHGTETNRTRHWSASTPGVLDRFRYSEVSNDAAVRLSWLRAIDELGVAFLSGLPAEPGRVLDVAALIGWVRETNYGRVFDVRSVPSPHNLADTALALGLHTDNPYREPVPGLQVLHCLRAGATGGDSVFADGFSVVEALRAEDRKAANVLESTPVRFTWSNATCYLSAERPIIEPGKGGPPTAVHYNSRSIAPLRLSADRVREFYRAYRAFAGLLRDPRLLITTRLGEGDVVVFNNRRVLHGRTAFDPVCERHLQGCYLDRDGLMSCIAVASGRSGASPFTGY